MKLLLSSGVLDLRSGSGDSGSGGSTGRTIRRSADVRTDRGVETDFSEDDRRDFLLSTEDLRELELDDRFDLGRSLVERRELDEDRFDLGVEFLLAPLS